MRQPIKGEKIYVPTSLHVYRGEDDFQGGLATIDKVEYSDHLPKDHCNYTMVGIKERKNTMYNWLGLLEKQEELEARFGEQLAHPDPDYRSEFNQPDADWKTITQLEE